MENRRQQATLEWCSNCKQYKSAVMLHDSLSAVMLHDSLLCITCRMRTAIDTEQSDKIVKDLISGKIKIPKM